MSAQFLLSVLFQDKQQTEQFSRTRAFLSQPRYLLVLQASNC